MQFFYFHDEFTYFVYHAKTWGVAGFMNDSESVGKHCQIQSLKMIVFVTLKNPWVS